MTIIESAGLKTNGALVDDEGRLQVFSAIEGEDRHINQTSGKAWSVSFSVTTTVGSVYVAYIKNTGTKNLHVTDVRANNTGVASEVEIDHVSGTTIGNADPVIAVSRNLGSPVEPDADMFQSTDGTGITGLTDEGLLFPKFAKANDEMHLRTTSNVIVRPGQAVAIKAITIGAALNGVISIVEVEVEVGAR